MNKILCLFRLLVVTYQLLLLAGDIIESSLKLHLRLHHGVNDNSKSIELQVPIISKSFMKLELESIYLELHSQFDDICKNQRIHFADGWNSLDCVDDLMIQMEMQMNHSLKTGECLSIEVPDSDIQTANVFILPPSSMSYMEWDEWDAVESEVKSLALSYQSSLYKSHIDPLEHESFIQTRSNSTWRCDSMRRFNKLFSGKFPPAFHHIITSNKNGMEVQDKYARAIKFLEGSYCAQLPYQNYNSSPHTVVAIKAWQLQCQYAIANLGYIVSRMNSSVDILYMAKSKSLDTIMRMFPNLNTHMSLSTTKEETWKEDAAATCLSLEPILVVTVASDDSRLQALRWSAERAGPCVELLVLGLSDQEGGRQGVGGGSWGGSWGNTHWSNDYKMRLLLKHLPSVHPERLVLFADG